jgi:predicted transposase
MKVVVTAKVKLADDSEVLNDIMRVYAHAVQFCIDTAWRRRISAKAALQRHCYYDVKARFGLQAQLVINAITQAVEMVKTAHSKPEVSQNCRSGIISRDVPPYPTTGHVFRCQLLRDVSDSR